MEHKEHTNQKKAPGLQRFAGLLQLPAGSISNATHMELEGNTQVRIENSGAILEYDSSQIRIQTGKGVTQFLGSNLTIRSLSEELLELHGNLTEIHFFF